MVSRTYIENCGHHEIVAEEPGLIAVVSKAGLGVFYYRREPVDDDSPGPAYTWRLLSTDEQLADIPKDFKRKAETNAVLEQL